MRCKPAANDCIVRLDRSPDAELMSPVTLEFRILGPLEVLGEHGPVVLGGTRHRALLAILLLEAGRVVSTDRLVDLLWGEAAPRTATTSLQNSISKLRRELGPEILETRAPGYVLRVDPSRVDANRFEQLLRDARRADPEERRALLEHALGLWRGPALAEFAFEQFAQAEIRRLEELRLVALEERIEADLELGHHGDVVGELESLVREHPLRETSRRQLMLALYRSGRQAEALDAYTDARARFVEELGIEPGPELKKLQAEILRHEAGLAAPGTGAVAADEESEIVKALLAGRVVPVLGLDGSGDLAAHLASAFDVPDDRPVDLARVSQYVATMKGSGPLYDELHALFEAAVEPTAQHRFLAQLPALLRERGAPHQLIVSTNYDLALERAFEDAGEELDIVAYVASGPHRGRFWHRPPGQAPRPIDVPNTYATELSLEQRTILLKLHGAVDPLPEREWESFVITEDDYIDYLGRSELTAVVPVALAAKLRRSHFLFLGYEMADWNLRLILNRVWGERPVAYRSWAVQRSPSALAQAFWRRYDVTPLDVEPEAYVELLERRLGAM
jgi:DNA-binding SARP family transcriptional activator